MKYKIIKTKTIQRSINSYYVKERYLLRERWLFFFWIPLIQFETKEMAESYLKALKESNLKS